MNGQAELKTKREESELCGDCGTQMFRVYHDKGFVFVEVRCKNISCGKTVIRKFRDYERNPNGGNNA
jgi:hypothetical protein